MSDFEIPNEEEVCTDDIREELLTLSEKGKLNYTPKYIQKASRDTLEKIKRKYDLKQLELTNELFTNMAICKYAEVLARFKMVRDPVELEKRLLENDLFKKAAKDLVGDITPHIPRIGLLCGGLITFSQIVNDRQYFNDKMEGPPDINLDS